MIAMPRASTRRSPNRSTSRPLPSADTNRIAAKIEMTVPAEVRPTPKCRANSGIAGATTPKPTATANATAASTPTSRGRSRSGFRGRPNGTRGELAGSAAPARAQVVAHHVLAEPGRVGREDAAAVAPGQLLDEPHQPRLVVEHEDVDRGTPSSDLLDLGEGQLAGLRQRRPVEQRPAVPA